MTKAHEIRQKLVNKLQAASDLIREFYGNGNFDHFQTHEMVEIAHLEEHLEQGDQRIRRRKSLSRNGLRPFKKNLASSEPFG